MKQINIHIEPDEVLYDIGMNVYTIGEKMTDADEKNRFLVQAGLDANNRPLVIRELTKSWQEILQVLSAYRTKPIKEITTIAEAAEDTTEDVENILTEKGGYDTSLFFPDNIPDDTGKNMVQAIHSYLASMGSALWTKRTAPDESQIFIAEAEIAITNVKRIAGNRTRPTRIKGYGF